MKVLAVLIYFAVTGMQRSRGWSPEVELNESFLTSNPTHVRYASFQLMSAARKSNSVECGIRGKSLPIAVKIVGGSPAAKHEFPWQARQETNWNMHVCGSIVIHQSWVVTAAHCLKDYEPSQLVMVAGDHQRLVEEGAEQRRSVKSIIIHPYYNSTTNENDIGLAKLVRPLKFDGIAVSPICLPPYGANISGDCVVSGWGYTEQGGELSDILRKVDVPVLTDGECQDNYRRKKKNITSHMLCAGYSAGGKDSCQADSGGPLACPGPNNRYFLAGVVSWGWGCAKPMLPGVYTEVSYFVAWIKSVMSSHPTATAVRSSVEEGVTDRLLEEEGDEVTDQTQRAEEERDEATDHLAEEKRDEVTDQSAEVEIKETE